MKLARLILVLLACLLLAVLLWLRECHIIQ